MARLGRGSTATLIGVLFAEGSAVGVSDEELLERFVSQRDEAAEFAFGTLVERHGPMVLSVCRNALRDQHDAEDAFQATFLVLARKAASLRAFKPLSPWLHGVARRICQKMRGQRSRLDRLARRAEAQALMAGARLPDQDDHSPEESELLHEEIGRLPDRYRIPVVLCYLEGLTHQQAARQLGWPIGTVGVRLMRARDRLRTQLTRRGLAPGLSALLPLSPRAEQLAGSLAKQTTRLAVTFISKTNTASWALSSQAAAVALGVLRAIAVEKVIEVIGVLFICGVFAAGTALALRSRATGAPLVAPPLTQKAGEKLATPELITTRAGHIQLRRIPAGEFMMGSPDDDKDAIADEKPQHRVRITRPFYLGVYEVTQAQYEAVMGTNPSWFSANGKGKDKVTGQPTDQHPVEQVSWLDAVKFCNKLSEREGLAAFYRIDADNVTVREWNSLSHTLVTRAPMIYDDKVTVPDWNEPGYRLPTEAEWEYACRANTQTRYSFGDDKASMEEFGWYDENSETRTNVVGRKRPNEFGLYDMHGNVWEWCWDGYREGYFKHSPADDPRGIDGAAHRVARGGGFGDNRRRSRSALRTGLGPVSRYYLLGFRLARGQPVRGRAQNVNGGS